MNKTHKGIIKFSLLFFVLISLSYAAYKEIKNSNPVVATNNTVNTSVNSESQSTSSSVDLSQIRKQAGLPTEPSDKPQNKDASVGKENKEEISPTSSTMASTIKDKEKTKNNKIIAYYFHGNARCTSCLKIEKLSKGTVKSKFESELGKGIIEWHTVNVEEPNNEHFVKDYKLYTKSVIVSLYKNGKEEKWKNLDKVWEYLDDENVFESYVQTEVASYLKEMKK